MNTRIRTRYRKITLVLLGGLALSQSGCLLAAAGACAGAGAYVYYHGNLSDSYGAEFGEVYQASKEALGDMAMPVITERHDGLTGTIESSLSDGTRVTIALEEKPRIQSSDGHMTEVGVRVGTFGDQALSTKMQQQISTRVAARMRSGPVPAQPVGRPIDRLPPLSADPKIQQTTATSGVPNGNNWKPAAQSNGEAPKPP